MSTARRKSDVTTVGASTAILLPPDVVSSGVETRTALVTLGYAWLPTPTVNVIAELAPVASGPALTHVAT